MNSDLAADQIVITKVFAPWCRACKGLEPKFLALKNSPKYQDLPLLWADLSIQHNKAFVKSLGVLALPTIQFYVGGQLVDTFPCGPSKLPILKRKLATLISEHVDAKTRRLKPESLAPTTETDKVEETEGMTIQAEPAVLTPEERQLFRNIPYFSELSLADVDDMLDKKARLVTFAPGSIIMKEGEPGRTFYVVRTGEVEVCQSVTSFGASDPLVATPPFYLGTVINRLRRGDYFGERALITGEPRAASIRAAHNAAKNKCEEPVTCWMLDKDDFPASSILSGKTKGSVVTDAMVSTVNDKYGVSLRELQEYSGNIQDAAAKASQVRGSFNNPQKIHGVDDDEEVLEEEDAAAPEETAAAKNRARKSEAILSLLTRFNLIRHVSRCFEYIVQTKAVFGDEGVRKRRLMLVSRLSPARRSEFVDAFALMDLDGDGNIELLELKRVMESIGESKSDEELMKMIKQGSSSVLDGRSVLSKADFLGIMAEAEFYHLFRDTFAALDKTDSGYVKACELDRVLSGVRDLISDDHRSIIDVDDTEMLVDYEQFSRMLLGSALL